MLAELKAHKEAKTWLLTATACEQQRTNNLMLTNINSVVAGKSICCFYIYFPPNCTNNNISLYILLFTVGIPVAPHPLENFADKSNVTSDDASNVAATGLTVTQLLKV